MDFNQVREMVEDHGSAIIKMDSGERYHVYAGDTNWVGGIINFDCGDEKYALDGDKVESVELPKSDRIE